MSNVNAMTQADINAKLAELERLKQEVADMRKQVGNKLTWKVSEKGCICVYGLQTRPVSLYGNQWKRLLKPDVIEGILKFIEQEEKKGSISMKKPDAA